MKVKLEEVCDILDSMRVPVTASERQSGPYPYYGANGIQDYVDGYIFDDELVLLAEDGGNFGSKDRPMQSRAMVALTFDNTDHYFNTDYTEIEIKRIVYHEDYCSIILLSFISCFLTRISSIVSGTVFPAIFFILFLIVGKSSFFT